MKQAFALGMIVLAGCTVVAAPAQEGDAPTGIHETIVKDMLGVLDQITESLKTVTDEQTAAAAKEGLHQAAAKWQQVRMKAESLKPPSKEEKERLEIYAERFVISQKQLFGQIGRVIAVPGGRELLKEIRSVLGQEKSKKAEPAKPNP